MLRYTSTITWFLIAIALASAVWALKVEITYERNVRHIPNNFRERYHPPTHRWKA